MSIYGEREHAILKLPKWAQSIINRQQERINSLRDELDTAMGKLPESPYFFEDYMMHGRDEPKRIYMPGNRGRIFVNVGKGRYSRDDLITVTREDHYGLGGVRLQADNELHLSMGSCNTVWVTPHSINQNRNKS